MTLAPGTTYTIVKPSFWRTRREVRNASNELVGYYQFNEWSRINAQGEARSRKLLFGCSKWNNRYARMTDISGNELATFEPVGWWGTEYKLVYGEKRYSLKISGWGTTFTLYEGDTEMLRATPGGYFKPGTITVLHSLEEKDAVALALFGLYEHYQINAAAAAASGAGAVVVTSS